jgi:anti-anti-sigma regulatory factor
MITVSNRSFYIEQVSDVTVVCFTVTKIVEQNYEGVSDELFELIEYLTSSGPMHVALDLSSVRKIDDWGLAMLRAFHETMESHRGTAVLCRIPQAVSIAMASAGFRDCFHIKDTRREAIGSFGAAQSLHPRRMTGSE